MNPLASRSTETNAQRAKALALLRLRPHHTYDLHKSGIGHPAARVMDLIKQGYIITSDRITTVDDHGYTRVRVAYYTLIREAGTVLPLQEPSEDELRELWEKGLALLATQEIPDVEARAYLGWLVREYGNAATLQAVRDPEAPGRQDVKPYLAAICRALRPTNAVGAGGNDE